MEVTSRVHADALTSMGNVQRAGLAPSVVAGLLAIVETLIIIGLGLVIFLIYLAPQNRSFTPYIGAMTVGTFLLIDSLYYGGFYDFSRITSRTLNARALLGRCGLVLLILLAASFAFKISHEFSRVWVFSWFFSSVTAITLLRLSVPSILRRFAAEGLIGRNVVVYGASAQGQRLVEHLRKTDDPWNRVIGAFDDRLARVGSDVAGLPVLGNLFALIEFARHNKVDEIIVALPWAHEERIMSIIRALNVLPVDVKLSTDIVGMNFSSKEFSNAHGIPMLNAIARPISGWHAIAKNALDHVFAFIGFVALLPVIGLLALAVKLDSPGPVFFRQKRYGFNNQRFYVWKFRTMHTAMQDNNADELVKKSDPRVTRVGRFLRRTSLDELPQLINVITGTMSLVGPRPHAIRAKAGGKLYADAVDQYAGRHNVKPGITGWAQVNGWRGETDTEEKIRKRVEYDLYYIENWSLWLDIRILFMTVVTVILGENSY